jgi:GNAT superfamily N-acetyltransferase
MIGYLTRAFGHPTLGKIEIREVGDSVRELYMGEKWDSTYKPDPNLAHDTQCILPSGDHKSYHTKTIVALGEKDNPCGLDIGNWRLLGYYMTMHRDEDGRFEGPSDRIHVTPDCRGQGLGNILREHMEDVFYVHGYPNFKQNLEDMFLMRSAAKAGYAGDVREGKSYFNKELTGLNHEGWTLDMFDLVETPEYQPTEHGDTDIMDPLLDPSFIPSF